MSFYERYILPRVIHFTCGMKPILKQREKVIPLARGRVLEIGIGSGLNLPFYDPARVELIWGLDPSLELWHIGKARSATRSLRVEFIGGSAENIPLADGSAETVVVTYSLCTIPDVAAALTDMRRVLKPHGKLIFCEHGLAPDDSVGWWQHRLNPAWRYIAGGCNLNRDIPMLLREAGFHIDQLNTMYLPGWRPGTFNYWGTAE